jgi:hypothetical protein
MVLTALAITMSSVTYFHLKSQRQLFLENLTTKGEALGRFVSLISPTAILAYDFESMIREHE